MSWVVTGIFSGNFTRANVKTYRNIDPHAVILAIGLRSDPAVFPPGQFKFLISVQVRNASEFDRLMTELSSRGFSRRAAPREIAACRVDAHDRPGGKDHLAILQTIKALDPTFPEIEVQICRETGIALDLSTGPVVPRTFPSPLPDPARIARGSFIIPVRPPPEKCTICLEYLNNPTNRKLVVQTKCPHYFHNDCLLNWQSQSDRGIQNYNLCPLCRRELFPP